MRRLILVTLLAGCGDNLRPVIDDGGTDATGDASMQTSGPCLDQPTDLARPPSGALPCDLLPPGFVSAP